MLDSVTGIGATPSFSTQQIFATGAAPGGLAIADINGDGAPDMIVANASDNTVSVFLNITPPGVSMTNYAPAQTFSVGSNPVAVTVADVNGGGKPDLIVANSGDNTISVLLNTTVIAPFPLSASFATQQIFATGAHPSSVITADINGDGKLDLIVTNTLADSVSVLLNNTIVPGISPLSFSLQTPFATQSHPVSVAATDMNGDGKVDLIVTNHDANTVSVLFSATITGASAPSFSTQQSLFTSTGPASVITADINGDGRPDLIITTDDSINPAVCVLLNTTVANAPVPSFAMPQMFFPGFGPVSVVAADLNGDGKLDLAVAAKGSGLALGEVDILLNQTPAGASQTRFSTLPLFNPAGSQANTLKISDMNRDGKLDLIVTNTGDNTVSVLLNTTAATSALPGFSTRQSFAAGTGPTSVAAADLNMDGKLDLIMPNYDDNTFSVLLNATMSADSLESFTQRQTFATDARPYVVAIADINGDGIPDVITANQDSDTICVFLNTTTPGATQITFSPRQAFSTGAQPSDVISADVNGDGRPDLIVTNFAAGSVSVLLNTTPPGASSSSFSTLQSFSVGLHGIESVAIDINGDGRPDLATVNAIDNTVSVLVNVTPPGAATASFASQQTFATELAPQSIVAADVNGDGKLDLIIANTLSNSVSVLLNTTEQASAVASFSAQHSFPTGAHPFSVAYADIDGDGKPDIIVASYKDSTVSVLRNTTMPGAATPNFATQQTFATGGYPFWVTATDLNGDGKPDLIVADTGISAVSILLNTQYNSLISGSPATGTIVHDLLFASGFQ
nr:VCBS repeat-containing protein [Pseudolysobacter antarcticus]